MSAKELNEFAFKFCIVGNEMHYVENLILWNYKNERSEQLYTLENKLETKENHM